MFAGGAAAVLIYFLWFAAAGVRAGFSPDDLTNMQLAFVRGTLWKHLADGVLFFVPASRPVGAAVYRFAYDVAGMNPALLHVLCAAVALVNLYLLFHVTRLISGSAEVVLLAVLIGAFHDNFLPLYYNAGYCYDLLSFSFFYTALLLYARERRRGVLPGVWAWRPSCWDF